MESLDSGMLKEGSSFFTTKEINDYLLETAKWGKFLAIMGYIGIGLILLAAVFVMVAGNAGLLPVGAGMPMSVFGLIYIALGALYFFPVNYLYRFSEKTKQGLNAQDPQGITAGFQNLKSLFKFMGIFTIVILSIYALIIVIAIVGGVMNAL